MKVLWEAVTSNKKNRRLFFLIILATILATLASQLEIFALGLITQKGPDVFQLFSSGSPSITLAEIQQQWTEIVPSLADPIDSKAAEAFMLRKKSGDITLQAFHWVDITFGIKDNLPRLAIFLVFIAFFKAATMFLHRYSTKLASIRISADLRQKYFEHIQTLPMSFYQDYSMGSLSTRVVGDASSIADALNACIVNYLQTPFTVLSTLILCFLTSWQLSLFIFFGFPLIILPIIYLSRGVKRVSKQIQGTQEKFSSVLLDFVGGIQTVKMFAMEDFSLQKYKEQNSRIASLEKKSAKYDLSTRPIVHTLAMAFLSVALVYGLYVLHMQVSEVLFYCGMLYLFYEPIKKFAEETGQIQRGVAAAERMTDVMNIKPEIEDRKDAIPLVEFKDEITFDHVWFAYKDEWVLKGLNLSIKKGQQVAIVGPTGTGKSTIVQLMPRLYEVQQGQILIDGKPLHSYNQKSIREKIAFVPQRPFLFMDTIAANISFGRPYSEEDIKKAAKKAHASEFIERLPLKYETLISEGGKNFSGGQQQRLAIARALVKDAPILIFDEATSSLDAVSEERIKQALEQLRGEMTQIIIAHRLSTIERADKIIYIEEGVKIDEGTKDELLVRCPPFKKMWELMHKNESKKDGDPSK